MATTGVDVFNFGPVESLTMLKDPVTVSGSLTSSSVSSPAGGTQALFGALVGTYSGTMSGQLQFAPTGGSFASIGTAVSVSTLSGGALQLINYQGPGFFRLVFTAGGGGGNFAFFLIV